MSTLEATDLGSSSRTSAPSGRRLAPAPAFALLVSILVTFLAASSAPTPLYAHYQRLWGFSAITVTVVFAVYALSVLAALLVFGSLSDYVGRRPVLLGAIAMQIVATVVFVVAHDVELLMVARILQGIATGSAAGALGAGLLDLDRTRGTLANAIGPLAGTGTGALVSGFFVQYLPAPTHLVYAVLIALLVAQGVGVLFMRETSSPVPGALASLRPAFGIPSAARHHLVIVVPVLVAVWSLAGFYLSLGPALVRLVSGSTDVVLGGGAVFVLAGSAALAVFVTRDVVPRSVMLLGTVALIAGVGLTLIAVTQRSSIAFFVGAAIAGVGFGSGFQGALRTVLPLSAAHERAGVLSTMYVVCYLAMGVPAIVAGVLVEHLGLESTARVYGIYAMALAAITLVGLVVGRRRVTR